MKKDGDV